MALADYHLCAVCSGKAFYDASFANDQYLEMCDRGQVRAICDECAKTHCLSVLELSKVDEIARLRAALEAAAAKCDEIADAEVVGQYNEWAGGRRSGAEDCAAAIRGMLNPASPTE